VSQIVPPIPATVAQTAEAAWKAASDTTTTGTLTILMKKGVSLLAADLNGKSDPYVIMRCGGQEKKTKVIHKTLNPEWNESFEFVGTLPQFLGTGLLLKCFDKDRFTRDDPLGNVEVPLSELQLAPHHEYEEKLPKKGTLFFEVSWKADPAPEPAETGAAGHDPTAAPMTPPAFRRPSTLPMYTPKGAAVSSSAAAAASFMMV